MTETEKQERENELWALVELVKTGEKITLEAKVRLTRLLQETSEDAPKRTLREIADEWRRDKFFEKFPDAVDTHITWRMVKEFIDLEDRFDEERAKLRATLASNVVDIRAEEVK